MKTRISATVVLGLPGVVACCSLLSPALTTASTVSPLPRSDYTVRHVCATPAPGHAGCLAVRLVPGTPAAHARVVHLRAISHSAKIGVEKASECPEAYTASCFAPQDLRNAYFPNQQPEAPVSPPQTIAIVDVYNDLNAEADLNHYSKEFGLPELSKCTGGAVSDCFEKLNQTGETKNLPFPQTKESRETTEAECNNEGKEAACKEAQEADGWAVEVSLDIEVSHAICQNCRIVLVEARSSSFPDLEEAEKTAAGVGATEISDSWGGSEQGRTPAEDNASPFNHPRIVITAAAGDNGYLNWAAEKEEERGFPDYPASSPHVVAVGGTRLRLGTGNAWAEETVWNGSGAGGGGCSVQLAAPAWQLSTFDWPSVGCGGRAVADISADADPYTGVAIYDSTPESPTEGAPSWIPVGGTSLASPIIASVFALAGGADGVEYPAKTLYENQPKLPNALHDVVSGSNGECKKKPLFQSNGTSSCSTTEEAINSNCLGELKCNAAPGYDGPTGVGTPEGITAFKPIDEEAKRQTEEKQREEKLREEERQREEKRKAEELGIGSGGGSTTGASGNTGAGGNASAGTGLTSGVGGGKASEKEGSSTLTIKLSAFALTPNALIALNRVQPKVSAVGFAFTLSAATRIRATLAKRVRVRGHNQWELLPADSLAFTAAKGRNHRRLASRHALTPGRYRLTLTPAHGSPRSLIFLIG
jgi:Subtilase family